MDCLTKVRRALEYRTDTRKPTGILMTLEFYNKLRKEIAKSNVYVDFDELFGIKIIVGNTNSYPTSTILSNREFIIMPVRMG